MSHLPVISTNQMNMDTTRRCSSCYESWPCEVVRLLEENERLKAYGKKVVEQNAAIIKQTVGYKDRIDAALAVHFPSLEPPEKQHQVECVSCQVLWPCPTVKALRGEK